METKTLQVADSLSVTVLPYEQHEYLMTTKEVANGYGVTEYAIRKNKMSLSDELIEGKHFVTAVTIGNGIANVPHNATLWTKRGIIRLGFAMRGERAKLFRNWAEELIIRFGEACSQADVPRQQLPQKRNHNRLTQERMVSILADVAKIDDKALRLSLVDKLMYNQ